MVSVIGAEVLDHIHNIASASKPATKLSASEADFVRQLRDISSDLLRHPEFAQALILKVDEVSRDDAEALKGTLALFSGVKYILDQKNLQHVVSVQGAQRRKAQSDKILRTDRNIAQSTGQSRITSDDTNSEEDCRPSDDKNTNRLICRPGRIIRVRITEALRDPNIKFGHPNFLSTPASPAMSKEYKHCVLFTVGNDAVCLRFESKHQRGLGAVHDDEKHKYFAVLSEREYLQQQMKGDYEGANIDSKPLLTNGLEYYKNSMLCFELTTVPLNSFIAPEGGTFIPESMVKIHDIVLRNAHVQHHMAKFLAEIDASHLPPTQSSPTPAPNDRSSLPSEQSLSTFSRNQAPAERPLEHSPFTEDPVQPSHPPPKQDQNLHLKLSSGPQFSKITGTTRLPDQALGDHRRPKDVQSKRGAPRTREPHQNRSSVFKWRLRNSQKRWMKMRRWAMPRITRTTSLKPPSPLYTTAPLRPRARRCVGPA